MRRYPNSSDDTKRQTPFARMMQDRKNSSDQPKSLQRSSNPASNTNRYTSTLPPVSAGRGGARPVEPAPVESSARVATTGVVTVDPTGGEKKTEVVITSSTSRKELIQIIEKQQADLQLKVDSVNALQRNFVRLSELYKRDSESWQKTGEELARLREEGKRSGSQELVLAAMKEELQLSLAEREQLKTELEQQREEQERQLEEVASRVDACQAEIIALQSEVDAANDERDEWIHRNGELESKINNHTKEVMEWESKCALLTQQKEAAVNEVAAFQAEWTTEARKQLNKLRYEYLADEDAYHNPKSNTGNVVYTTFHEMLSTELFAMVDSILSRRQNSTNAQLTEEHAAQIASLARDKLESMKAFQRTLLAVEEGERRHLVQAATTAQQQLQQSVTYALQSLSRSEGKRREWEEQCRAAQSQSETHAQSSLDRVSTLEKQLAAEEEKNRKGEAALVRLTEECHSATTQLQQLRLTLDQERQQHAAELARAHDMAKEVETNAQKSMSDSLNQKITNAEQLYRSEQQQNSILRREIDILTNKNKTMEAQYQARLAELESSLQMTTLSQASSSQQALLSLRLMEEESTTRQHLLREETTQRSSLVSYHEKYLLLSRQEGKAATMIADTIHLSGEEAAQRQALLLECSATTAALTGQFSHTLLQLSRQWEQQKAGAGREEAERERERSLMAAVGRATTLEKQVESLQRTVQQTQEDLEEGKKANYSRDRAAVAALHKLMAAEQASESSYSCPSCFQLFTDPLICVPCGHTYCKTCLYQHPKNRSKAPPMDSLLLTDNLFCAECGSNSCEVVVEARWMDNLAGVLQYKKQVLGEILANLERKVSAASSRRTSVQ